MDFAPVKEPKIVAVSDDAMQLLGAPAGFAADVERSGSFAAELAANAPMPGATPAAHCYCGHQFGHFAGQLGDGAAMYVGTVSSPSGQRLEVQFKGSGLTPYSRSADGRKVLRSSLREYMASEHMAALGVPTTRAGSVVTSDSRVMRDPQYDGHPVKERCTVITRIAETFLRFGSFEVVKDTDPVTGQKGPSPGDTPLLTRLVDVTAKEYFPDLWAKHRVVGDQEDILHPLTSSYQGWDGAASVALGAGSKEPDSASDRRAAMTEDVFREVARRTARLVAKWQAIGWCHGVLNTDNMSIVGLTIDYGPYGFLDATDLNHICNGSDNGGRYTYAKQPEMCKWNLGKLAEVWRTLAPQGLGEEAVDALLEEEFDAVFAQEHTKLFAEKLGLTLRDLSASEAAAAAEGGDSGTAALIHSLMNTLQASGADFTSTFRALSRLPVPLPEGQYTSAPGGEWQQVSVPQVGGEGERHVALPSGAQPVLEYIVSRCRTLADQRAACASTMPDEQLEFFVRLLKAGDPRIRPHTDAIVKEIQNRQKAAALQDLKQSDLDAANRAAWANWLAVYARRLGADLQAALDEGGETAEEGGGKARILELLEKRHSTQLKANPRYILRNYIAEACIAAAEQGDYGPTREVMKLLVDPYDMGTPPSQDEFLSGFSPQVECLTAGGDADGLSRAGFCTPPDTPACSVKGQVAKYDEVPPRWAADLCVTCSS